MGKARYVAGRRSIGLSQCSVSILRHTAFRDGGEPQITDLLMLTTRGLLPTFEALPAFAPSIFYSDL